jgi:tRNA(Ile)-lysidine synthase
LSLHFEDAVAAALEESPSMAKPGGGKPESGASGRPLYLAAVSGGADSVALLAALVALRELSPGFALRCVHVEHGIRAEAESRGDAEFVRSLCAEFRVPCRVVSVKPGRVAEAARRRGVGMEAAARLYRHRAWHREADRLEAQSPAGAAGRGPVRILVAHTSDDQKLVLEYITQKSR